MNSIETRLKELGYELKAAPAPAANYLPYRISGNHLYLSGVLAMRDGEMTHTGAVGDRQTEEAGYEAARVCALNVLASAKAALGSLECIKQLLLVNGYVNAVDGFTNSPQVINGASDLFAEVLGEAGRHARAAVAVNGLPKDSTVELQVVLEFE